MASCEAVEGTCTSGVSGVWTQVSLLTHPRRPHCALAHSGPRGGLYNYGCVTAGCNWFDLAFFYCYHQSRSDTICLGYM